MEAHDRARHHTRFKGPGLEYEHLNAKKFLCQYRLKTKEIISSNLLPEELRGQFFQTMICLVNFGHFRRLWDIENREIHIF